MSVDLRSYVFLKKPVRFAEVLETVKRLLHIQ